jgi:hypothetical protein
VVPLQLTLKLSAIVRLPPRDRYEYPSLPELGVKAVFVTPLEEVTVIQLGIYHTNIIAKFNHIVSINIVFY